MFEVLVDHEFGNVEAIGGNMSLELERERDKRECCRCSESTELIQ